MLVFKALQLQRNFTAFDSIIEDIKSLCEHFSNACFTFVKQYTNWIAHLIDKEVGLCLIVQSETFFRIYFSVMFSLMI